MRRPTDPVERIIFDALTDADIPFLMDGDVGYKMAERLDFKVMVDPVIFIECKQFHTPRSNEQLTRSPNIILIQSIASAKFFADMIRKNPATELTGAGKLSQRG